MAYPDAKHKQLFEAILKLKSPAEASAFFRDLLTISELDAAAERWQMAKLLWTTDLSYKQIAKKTGGSTTTITRVAHWLNHGMEGYKTILKKMPLDNQRK
jgi:TrpR-related protein YerC/YecD